MAIEVGRFGGGWGEILELVGLSFAAPWNEAQLEAERKIWEPGRSLVATEDGVIVGHTCALSLDLTVPGAQLPVAGVSMVGVLPTHRRRGVLRELMRRQLTDLYETGAEPVASLTASEPAIYGRFGYGLASEQFEVMVPKAARALREVAGIDDIRISYADPMASLEVCTALRNTLALDRPGMFQFDDRWKEHVIGETVVTDASNASPMRCVLAKKDGETTGYAHYRTKRSDRNHVDVHRVHAKDVASHMALWRFLLDQDLLTHTFYGLLPCDDPLLTLLVDPRSPNAMLRDGHWVRVVDVGRALAGRTYATEIDVVLAVEDDLEWNAGAWHLTGGPQGATCEKTERPADLRLGVRELGTVYLGRPSLERLGVAGLVEERTPGVLRATSAAFLGNRLPWLDTAF
jgi:predicted acetyltransferase